MPLYPTPAEPRGLPPDVVCLLAGAHAIYCLLGREFVERANWSSSAEPRRACLDHARTRLAWAHEVTEAYERHCGDRWHSAREREARLLDLIERAAAELAPSGVEG